MIFKKLCDSRLKVTVTGVKTVSMHDSNTIAHEQQSIDAFNRTFANTDFSEISSIYKAFSKHHPFYNGEVYPKIKY